MKLFSRNPRPDEIAAQRDRLANLEGEAVALRGEVVELRELVSHLDQDTQMLLAAIETLEPGKSVLELARIMHSLVFRPFDLASFFVALVDWDKDLLEFPFYHEGGRPRQHPSRKFSERPGLTGRAILSGAPLYTRTLEEAEELGTILTEAEKGSGLIPASWYGVPLGSSKKPFGLVSFQSFQVDAFSEHRLRMLNALSEVLAMAIFGRLRLYGR
jgi:GAF domain-containing protein